MTQGQLAEYRTQSQNDRAAGILLGEMGALGGQVQELASVVARLQHQAKDIRSRAGWLVKQLDRCSMQEDDALEFQMMFERLSSSIIHCLQGTT